MRHPKMIAALIGSCIGISLTFLASLIPSVNIDQGLSQEFNIVKDRIESSSCSYDFPAQYEVIFEDLQGDEIGVCERKLFNWQIKIDPRIWSHLKSHERLALMIHEVSHCALKREHVEIKHHLLNAAFPLNLTEDEVNIQFENIIMECEQR